MPRLTVQAIAHAPQAAVRFQEKAVVDPPAAIAGDAAGKRDLFRAVLVRRGAVAQLAVVIAAHRPQVAVGRNEQTVIFASGDGHDIAAHYQRGT